jgi:DNA-binding protein HU-beta
MSDSPIIKEDKLKKGDNPMNKTELINQIAESANITKKEAGNALQSFIMAVTDTLEKGDKLQLVGFGTFSVTQRSAREGRNPQTGKTIKIPAKKVVKFKVGSKLSEAVN